MEPVWIYGADGLWHQAEGATGEPGTDPPPPPPSTVKFAGHLPFQVRIGMNAVENKSNPNAAPRPQYDEAATLVGGDPGNVRRVFDGGNWISTNRLNTMVSETDESGQLAVGSLKVPSNRWDLVIAGNYDADLVTLRNWAIARRAAGKSPVLMTIHHEPNGDGPGSDNVANMRTWGLMQMYALNFFTGWRSRGTSNTGGTYNAGEDVRDIMAWTAIANGFWWGTKFYHPDRIAAAYPADLIAAFNDRGGPLCADMYDPTNATYTRTDGNRVESSITFAANYDSCWRQIQRMVTWARTNNVKAIGFGEMGNVTLANWDKTIEQLLTNRDIIAYACTFNNFQNSKWDWRHIPANYPVYNATNQHGLVDYGGDSLSAGYIEKFKTLRDRAYAETNPF